MKSEARIPELDGLRGIAVIMVLVWHFVGSLWAPAAAWTIFGRTGVDLFFVLSGFLIVGILIDNRDSPSLFRTFYIRRAARILPPYALLMVLYWACYLATGPNAAFNADPNFPVQLGAQALFAYNWLMAAADGAVARGFSVTWSVAIEEQFYLVAPLALWLLPPQHLRKAIVMVGLASVVARAGFYLLYPQFGLAAYILTPFRLDCLCAGAFIATIWRDPRAMKAVEALPIKALFVAAACAVPLLVVAIQRNIWWHMHLWGHTYLSILYGLALLAILLRGKVQTLRNPILQEAGRISYALYLFHPLFISLFFLGRAEAINSWLDAMRAAAALAVTVALCYLSYFAVERPIRSIGHRARYAPPIVASTSHEIAG